MRSRAWKKGLLAISFLITLSLDSAEWSGYTAAETRVFERSPLSDEQKGGVSAALILEPEL